MTRMFLNFCFATRTRTLPEKNAAYGSSEGDRHTGGGRGRKDLPFLRLVPAVFGEEVGEDVARAARHVDHRSLFAQTENTALQNLTVRFGGKAMVR